MVDFHQLLIIFISILNFKQIEKEYVFDVYISYLMLNYIIFKNEIIKSTITFAYKFQFKLKENIFVIRCYSRYVRYIKMMIFFLKNLKSQCRRISKMIVINKHDIRIFIVFYLL